MDYLIRDCDEEKHIFKTRRPAEYVIYSNISPWSWERTGSKFNKDTLNETMGERYSYRECLALLVVTVKQSSHRWVGVAIGESLGLAGEARLNCNLLWWKRICLQVCKQGCKTVEGIYTTTIDWPQYQTPWLRWQCKWQLSLTIDWRVTSPLYITVYYNWWLIFPWQFLPFLFIRSTLITGQSDRYWKKKEYSVWTVMVVL